MWHNGSRYTTGQRCARRMNRRRNVRPLLLEQLENRTVLSLTTFTVTGIGDSLSDPYTATSGDLRYCVNLADANTSNPDGSLIQFDPTVFSTPQTITLGSGLTLSNTVDQTTITGPAAALTVSGGGPSSSFNVFTVNSGVTASISGLTISNGNTSDGGGVHNAGNLTLTNDTLSGNSASDVGGGVFNDGTATLTNDTLSGNSASDVVVGVFNDGTATLTNDTLSGNSAQDYGGGVFNDGTATLTNDTLSGNSAQDYGGGVYNDGTATLTNDTLSGNSASDVGGGGVWNSGTATLNNDTLSGNSAQHYGGGVWNSGTATLNNTVVANSPSGGDIYGSVSGSNNRIGDASTAGGFTNGVNGNIVGVSPLLAPLGNYGGPTQTMALLPGSPAIAAGSIALAVDPTTGGTLAYDQRGPGFPRTVNGTVDIGAYEFTPLSQTISFGPLADQTYGVAPITLSATDASGLPVSFSVISGPATISGSVLTVTGAGTVDVEADQAGNATYAAATPVDRSFTVAPALLTITPTAGQSMDYGGTVPALAYTYTGLVNSDTSATFSGGLATSATSSSSVGGYAITQGTLAATGNYTIGTFNPGTLTVNAAPLTVTATGESMTYGGTVPALAYTYTGLVNGDSISSVTLSTRLCFTLVTRTLPGLCVCLLRCVWE